MGNPCADDGFYRRRAADPAAEYRDRFVWGIDTRAIKRERQDLPEHPVVKG